MTMIVFDTFAEKVPTGYMVLGIMSVEYTVAIALKNAKWKIQIF
jgi:hypothetical protein